MQGDVAFKQFTRLETSESADGSNEVIESQLVIIEVENVAINAFNGIGTDGASINIQEAKGALVIIPEGVAGTLRFTAETAFGSFGVGSEVVLEVNKTNKAINVAGSFGGVNLEAGLFVRVIAGISIDLPGVELDGNFSFQQIENQSGETITVVTASNVVLFVGDNTSDSEKVGLEMTDGSGFLIRTGNETDGFIESGSITGKVRLLGFDGIIDLETTLTLRVNESSQSVNESVTINGEIISIQFSESEVDGFLQLSGDNIALSIADVADFRGDLTFTRDTSDPDTSKFLIGSSNL